MTINPVRDTITAHSYLTIETIDNFNNALAIAIKAFEANQNMSVDDFIKKHSKLENIYFDITAYILSYAPVTTLSYQITIMVSDVTPRSNTGLILAFDERISQRLLTNTIFHKDLVQIMQFLPAEKLQEVTTYFEPEEI